MYYRNCVYFANENINNISMKPYLIPPPRSAGESMALRRLYIFPVILFVLLPVTFMITYSVAVVNEHVVKVFPYISETGDFPPESCIFSLCLNFAAFTMAFCIYVRYVQVYHYPDLFPNAPEVNPKVNLLGLILGWISCIGLDLVANFQEMHVLSVHTIGAMSCFGSGTLYFLVQVWISHKMPKLASKRIIVIRAILVLICVVSTITTIASGSIGQRHFNGPKPKPGVKIMMKPEYGGWEWYLTSTITEWILCVTYSILMLTFVPELYDLELAAPIIRYQQPRNGNKKRLDA